MTRLTSNSAAKSVFWIFGILAACGMLALPASVSGGPGGTRSAPQNNDIAVKVEVIDLKQLVHDAPEYPKLASLDSEIDSLEKKIEVYPLEHHRACFHDTPQQFRERERRYTARLLKFEQELQKVKSERKKLYAHILEHISERTARVAEKNSIVLSEAAYIKTPADLTREVQLTR